MTPLLERYALLATGAIWSWVAGNENLANNPGKWLPEFLVLFFGLRTIVLTKHTDDLSKYLRRVERAFTLPKGIGFEKYFKQRGKVKRISAYIFLVLLLLATAAIPIIFNI